MSKNVATKDAKQALEEMAKTHAPAALAALVRVFTHGKSEPAIVAAASALLDRSHGKARQAIELSAKRDLRLLSDGELEALATTLLNGPPGGGPRPAGFLAAPGPTATAGRADDFGDEPD